MQIWKSIIRHCLALTPYEVRRRPPTVKAGLPPATLDNITLVLAHYVVSGRPLTFVQIGACDGIAGDSTRDVILSGSIRAILVEPIEQSFCKLQRLYEGLSNVTTVRAAIGPRDGQMTLFKVKEQAATIDPYWACQLASFKESHLLKHGVLPSEIERVEVPCLTLKSLLGRCGLDDNLLLQTDAEGFDSEIVNMALQLPILPEGIAFEHIHLDAPTIDLLFARLQEHGYVWTHDEWNTLALRRTLLNTWHQT